MKYVLLLNRTEDALPEPGTPAAASLAARYAEAVGAMAQAGVLVECLPLHSRSASTTVRVRNGETLITDGPSAEIKEQLGGVAILECADLDEALDWAGRIPAAADASIEVRPAVPVQKAG